MGKQKYEYKGDTPANKELPQEVRRSIMIAILSHFPELNDNTSDLVDDIKECVESHYLKELQAKDTTIKNQAEQINKLTGLLLEEVYKRAFTYCVRQDCTEDAARHAANKFLNDYKEQHNITPNETKCVSVLQRLPPEKQGGYSDFYEVKCLEDGLIARYSFEHESWQLPNGGGWLNGVTHWLMK